MKNFLTRTRTERGTSLLEVMMTVAIMGVVGGMGTAQMAGTRRSMQGDGAMRVVMSQLTAAREMAITQRRNMEVQFIGGNWIRIVRHEAPGIATTVLTSVALEGNVTFSLTSGVPDTPDTFGAGNAVCFGMACASQGMMFGSEGQLMDANGNPLNGTVFLSIPNAPLAVRAVTVLGTIGRVRGYKWVPTQAQGTGGWSRV
jgi:Tfp pilus assembly protein FimT